MPCTVLLFDLLDHKLAASVVYTRKIIVVLHTARLKNSSVEQIAVFTVARIVILSRLIKSASGGAITHLDRECLVLIIILHSEVSSLLVKSVRPIIVASLDASRSVYLFAKSGFNRIVGDPFPIFPNRLVAVTLLDESEYLAVSVYKFCT